MKSEARTCVVCGQLGTTKWTLSSGDDIAIVDLCVKHSRPMRDIVKLNQEKPAEEAKPWEKSSEVPHRIHRGMAFEPLLDWQPPATDKPTDKQ